MLRLLRTLTFLWAFLTLHSLAAAEDIDPARAKADPEGSLLWYDLRLLDVEGKGWAETKAPFDRLPARADGVVRQAVWDLSRHSAGLCVRFVTDSQALHARWTLTGKTLALPHMPATAVSGLDLYMLSKEGPWRWLAVGRPTQFPTNRTPLAVDLPPGRKEFLLYLPLYNGVAEVEIGLPRTGKLAKSPPRLTERQQPIVFYGTSITHGASASRPGMVHTAILGRRLDRPVLNLGFSGNGKMDPELAPFFAELDPAVYVLDCLPNMTSKEIEERAEPFVRTLLKARPKTPILLVEDRTYANAFAYERLRDRHVTSRAALRKVFDKLVADKAGGVHYLAGDRLLGDDGEGTVDGSHPTDLGFSRQADAFEKSLAPLLPRQATATPVEGCTDRLSYQAGDEIAFHIAAAGKYNLEIARLGAERVVVWKQQGLPGKPHPIPPDASSHGCRWPAAFRLKVPADWQSGYYTGRMEATLPNGKTARSELWFIIRSANPGRDTRILLQLCTNTYNAYSNWGGYSLYSFNGRFGVQGRRVSFDRPVHTQFGNWELPFVQWAEKAGYRLDYAANSDLEFHPDLLKHYRLVLSVGHDEYWSAPMRDHLEKFIGDGGNVAFFSGNTCCWQVRSEENGRALVCWKQSYQDDPFFAAGRHALLSALWSHHRIGRPENQLTGVGFLWGGYHKSHGQFMDGKAEFTVQRPEHWLFEGAGLKRGDTFGGKDTVVGYECDGCEITWKDGLPFPTHGDGTPRTFEVLATCPARWHPDDCEWYEKWEKGRSGHAVLGVYTRGGTVVTTGTTDWSHGLRGNDAAVSRITRNVLDRLSK